MSEENPIPDYLADAFGRAILVCRDWSGDDKHLAPISVARVEGRNPEPHTVDAVCEVVSGFTDVMPDQFVEWLIAFPYNACDAVRSDRTFANGARCLREVIGAKRRMFHGDKS